MKKIQLSSFYLLHAITIFLSAFLVFQIQPILSKTLLPWFGGTSSVWATSLLFFSSALFVGYLYVYLISKLSQRVQAKIHLVLLVTTLFVTLGTLKINSSLTFPLDWTQSSGVNPALIVIFVLTLSIGLPYTVLASTSPLIQSWFSQSDTKNSYHLYAISNAGSFVALISYPFVFERALSLKNQQFLWATAFTLFAALCSYISVQKIRTAPKTQTREKSLGLNDKIFEWKKWVAFSAFPSFMLVATTSSITQKIAPVPLLWVVPLAIYLLTFVFAFSGFGNSILSRLLLAVTLTASFSAIVDSQNTLFVVCAFTSLLFSIGLNFHAKLYEHRPPDKYSTTFYLYTSIGGMAGTLIGSIIPPIIFNEIYEFKIGLVIASAFLAYTLYAQLLKDRNTRLQKGLFAVASLMILSTVSVSIFANEKRNDVIYSNRSFYGAVRVEQDDTARYLINDELKQGFQFRGKDREFETTNFYLSEKGVLGSTIQYLRDNSEDSSLKIGVIGLGVGVLAGQCRTDDEIAFFEINPDVEKVAKNYFTFLKNCNNVEIEIGDGRIALNKSRNASNSNKFDIIIVDAFNGGSIPTHLLTKEAIEIYRENLEPKFGIIGLHISNKYLDLKPVGLALAKDGGYRYLVNEASSGNSNVVSSVSTWAFLALNPKTFESPTFNDLSRETTVKNIDVWTDQKTDIFSVLK